MKKIIQHYKECTGLSEKVIVTNLLQEHDSWLTPEEAIKFNLADKISITKKKPTKKTIWKKD